MKQIISSRSFFKIISVSILALSSAAAYAVQSSPPGTDFNHLRLLHVAGHGEHVELTNAAGKTNGAHFGSGSTGNLTIIPIEGTGWATADFNKQNVSYCAVSGTNTCRVNVDGLEVTGISLIKLAKSSAAAGRNN